MATEIVTATVVEPYSRYECPRCHSREMPRVMTSVSTAGWIVFWVLGLFTLFTLSWIGFFLRDTHLLCKKCGAPIA